MDYVDDLVADMFGSLVEVGNQVIDMANISKDFKISRDGSFVQQISTGVVFHPATYNKEWVYVLPMSRGGKPRIMWAKNLVWNAFNDPRYLRDLKKNHPSYSIEYINKDRESMNNPDFLNLQAVFYED